MFAGGVVELHRTVHHSVIGERDGGGTVFGAPATEFVDPTGAVKQGILGMDVEMNERTQPIQTLNTRCLNFYRCLT